MLTLDEQIELASEELLKFFAILTCQETNYLDRVENLKYYFYGFKHDLEDLLNSQVTLQSIVIEDAISDNGYSINMQQVRELIDRLIGVTRSNFTNKNQASLLLAYLKKWNHLLYDSINNPLCRGC